MRAHAPSRPLRAPQLTPLLAVLGAGLALRLVLGLVVFRGQGFAIDMGIFRSWADALLAQGPGVFYAAGGRVDYPPGYAYVLWALGALSGPASAIFGTTRDAALVTLLKVPAILADVGVAALLYRVASRLFGVRAGVVAAALYLFIPVTWYDSALWGQVDGVVTLVMMAALVLLIEGWSEAAAVAAVLALLVKPQGLAVLVIVGPVLLRRHLLKVGSGPVPAFGQRLSRLNERLGGLLARQGPIRLLTSAVAAGVTAALVLAPFDIAHFAPASLARIPVLGDFAGLVGLIRTDASEYPSLTLNAYNAWALVGPDPLVHAVGAAGGGFSSDSLRVVGDVSAFGLGLALLGVVVLLVAGGLLRRDGWLPVVLGFTLVAFALYAVPTRSHERYLFPVFASGAILVSGAIVRAASFVVIGILNALNLHAVLDGPLAAGGQVGPGVRPGAGAGFRAGFPAEVRLPGGLGPGGAPSGPRVFGGGGLAGGDVTQIQLPFGDFAHSALVATTVIVVQTAALLVLVAAWLFVIAVRRSRQT